MRRSPIVTIALLAVATATLAGCKAEVNLGDETLDEAELEQQLAVQLAPQAGVKPDDVTVTCPEGQEVSKGATFECTLVAPNGDEVRVDVTLTNDNGDYEANVPRQQFK